MTHERVDGLAVSEDRSASGQTDVNHSIVGMKKIGLRRKAATNGWCGLRSVGDRRTAISKREVLSATKGNAETARSTNR